MKGLLLILVLSAAMPSQADDHAVVLLYHHVSDDTPAATSVSPAVLEQHLQFLEQHQFNVWTLGRILDTLAAGNPLPANTVALSFDDAYLSVFTQAYPRLKQRGWPFTLFVNSEAIDRGYQHYMNWDQIRELAGAGVEIGNHSHSHAHLVRQQAQESTRQWRERVRADIRLAQHRIEQETGANATLFAYPYGEYSAALKEIIAALGLQGIAQQSGAVGIISDQSAIPRFPMATGYADMQRFAMAVNARPLPVRSAVALSTDRTDGAVKQLQLQLDPGAYQWPQLACYSATGKPLPRRIDDQAARRFTLDLSGSGTPGRNKINCTAPAADEAGAYFWYSYQWLQRHPDGSWYAE